MQGCVEGLRVENRPGDGVLEFRVKGCVLSQEALAAAIFMIIMTSGMIAASIVARADKSDLNDQSAACSLSKSIFSMLVLASVMFSCSYP